MNSFSILEEEEEDYVQKTSVEYFKFVSLATDIRVDIQDKPLEFSSKDSSVSLIACSIKNGYFIAASNQGFVYGETAVLRKGFYNAPKGKNISFTDKIEVNVSSPVLQLRLSYDESHIIVGTSRALLIYQLSDIQTDRENVKPVKEWNLDEEIMDVRPNTESHPNLVAILFSNNQCRIMDMMDGTTQCQLPSEDITALCWSPKGRQIVCGRKNGYLEHYDISGNKKDSLPIPSAVSTENEEEPADRYVKDVLWIDNNTFLPIYARERSNEEDEFVFDGFIINRKPHSEDGPQYTRLAELTPIFSNGGHGDHFYMEIIHNLGEEIKCMVVIANAASTEISVVGQDADGEWSTWEIPEGGEILLPLSEETFMDTYPVGLALDFAPNETLPPLDASIDETRVQPMPILYVLNDEAKVSAYHCYNITLARTGGTYKPPASVSTSTVSSSSTPAPSIPAASTAPASTAPASTTPSAFGSFASTQGTSSFSDLLSGKTKSVSSDGFGGFGGQTTASIPSFQNLGSSQKLAPIMSSPLTAKPNFSNTPSFGSTSNIGFGTTTPLGFGSGTMSSAMTDKPLASFKSSSTAEDKTDKPAATTFTAFGQSEATSDSVLYS
ncbi:hypothetical protein BDB01DRAFT_221656 [Pilobolus umbonatus]|nr:hypothetical protein BDB01DRAFT_221656 [Pilobolus umbonatus]